MWEQIHVLFVTINLPGGSNNDQDVWYAAPVETTAQTVESHHPHRRRPSLARRSLHRGPADGVSRAS